MENCVTLDGIDDFKNQHKRGNQDSGMVARLVRGAFMRSRRRRGGKFSGGGAKVSRSPLASRRWRSAGLSALLSGTEDRGACFCLLVSRLPQARARVARSHETLPR